ncbi:MAG: iron chelate uptake ABC transporter family permease subunit, partial [Chloroflexi bacterium]|nr:iron chelate uptake ABC transporter family permease subunit [Chloroflexota bacterium]
MAHPLTKEDTEETEGAHPAVTLPRPFAYPWRRLSLGAGAVVAIALLAATQGAVGIPLLEVAKIVLSRLPGVELSQTWPQSWDTIIWQIRLPRVVVAGLVGAALAMSGAMYQGLFRNPLADPYLIGVAAGAGLGATIIFISPIPVYWGAFSLVTPAAFVTALAAVTLAYLLARIGGVASTTTLILAGVAIASIAAAG